MKKREFIENQETEYLFLTTWCLNVLDYIYNNYPIDQALKDLHRQAFSAETKNKYLDQVSPSLYLKGLRQAFRDTNEMAKDMPSHQLNELNKILKDKFGKDLNDDFRNNLTRIKSVLKRGKIVNDEEYEIIERRVDELCQTNNASTEIKSLNGLLINYQTKS